MLFVPILPLLESRLNEEWKLLESVIEVLAQFEWATRTLSGDKYSTLMYFINGQRSNKATKNKI
jgi:hypothetical protein